MVPNIGIYSLHIVQELQVLLFTFCTRWNGSKYWHSLFAHCEIDPNVAIKRQIIQIIIIQISLENKGFRYGYNKFTSPQRMVPRIGIFCLHTVKWFQSLLFTVYTLSNGSKRCYTLVNCLNHSYLNFPRK